MQKVLVILALVLLVVAAAWPWLGRVPFGRLPGDLVIERPGLRAYLPFTTMLVVSLVVSLLLWLLRR